MRPVKVSFEVADVFSWNPGTRFDVIFFSAWLSHVPASRFGQFWQLLGNLLARNGRVLFIDEHVDERGKEAYVAGRDEVIERRLRDGSTFRVIKNFVDPQELELRLRRLGWDGTIRRDGSDWVYGEAPRGPRAGRRGTRGRAPDACGAVGHQWATGRGYPGVGIRVRRPGDGGRLFRGRR